MDDQTLVRIVKALADRTRLRMVRQIARAGELSCGSVGSLFHLSQPTVSHHLKILAGCGLLMVRREGQRVLLSVDRALFARALASLALPKAVAARTTRTAQG